MELKQSTSATIKIGPFISSADATPQPAASIVYGDVKLSKNGGGYAAKADTTNPAADLANGMYTCVLGTGDTDTLGRLQLQVAATGCLLVIHNFEIITAEQWDTRHGSDRFTIDLQPGQSIANTGGVTVTDKTGFALTAAYDPAKTAASQTSVDSLNSYVSGAIGLPEINDDTDTIIGAISAINLKIGSPDSTLAGDILALPSAVAAAVWNYLTSAMTTTGSIGKKVADWVVNILTAAYDNAKNAASQTSVNAIPTNPITSLTGIAKTTDVVAARDIVTTAIADKAVTPATDTSTIEADLAGVKVQTDQLVFANGAVDANVDMSGVEIPAPNLDPITDFLATVYGSGDTLHQHIITLGGIAQEGVTCMFFDEAAMTTPRGGSQVSRADGSVFVAGTAGQHVWLFAQADGYSFEINPVEVII